MKVIFLDVDGVLINRKAYQVAYNEKRQPRPWLSCIMELNRIVKETEARVVMSSCWRIGRTLIEVKELLHNWEFVGICIGMTPYLRGNDIKRGDEIQWWLDEYKKQGDRHGTIEKFVIVDDDKDMKHLLPYLVKCNFNTGLTAPKADLVIEKLK